MWTDEQECCGRCKWHCHKNSDGWSCENPESEFNTFYTDYSDSCDSWEEK